jgi:hypothetical protein
MVESPPSDRIELLLSRPIEQRKREFQYRFAQSVVFGLPVLFLQYVGPSLGGIVEERQRWIGILQGLLAGWVVYVGAMGMVFEGILLLGRKLSIDLLVGIIALGCWVHSAISVLHVTIDGKLWYEPLLFHGSVTSLAVWTGIRWWQLTHRAQG